MRNRIRYHVLLVVGLIATIGQIATAIYYSRYQEQTVLAQHELSMRKLTESVLQGLQSVMLAGSADIAQAYAERLRQVPEIVDFRIMRRDGFEAFRDNQTILDVNVRRGEDMFITRESEVSTRVIDASDPDFQLVLKRHEPVVSYGKDEQSRPLLQFLAPIKNMDVCHRCHGKSQPLRGVVKLTTDLGQVESEIHLARKQSVIVLCLSLLGTILLTGYMLGRTVVKPIEKVTDAMSRISGGDLNHQVDVSSGDEIGQMAKNFNEMTRELKGTYNDLRLERDKLTTIIESASEGMVVTDASGKVVIVNAAAARLLDKLPESIATEGFQSLLDNSRLIESCLQSTMPVMVDYKERTLQVIASVIYGENGQSTGSAAMIRDCTNEKRLENDLRRLATTDALTGLFNRRFLDQTLVTEFQRATRSLAPISLIMFDVDHFKKFNDTHGHDQGDRVLQMVAMRLRESVRSFDFPCRYGGEEFVAILPGLSSLAARELAERLRLIVADTEVNGLHVHISLGVAAYPECAASDAAALIETADAALYRAKESGRNRVVVAEETP